MKIEVIHHASIKLIDEKTIYFDPYLIKDEVHDADYIFITHDHYDHYDEASIINIRKDTTKVIVPRCLEDKGYDMVVDSFGEYKIDTISFWTIPAYNTNRQYHLKEMNYVGYQLLIDGVYYYIMGDTNRTEEADQVKTDICFVPIGGTYTMDVLEAAKYINDLKPKKAIPIHYGLFVGDVSLGEDFKNRIDKNIEVELKIGEEK